MTVMSPLPADHPMMVAWNKHKATDEYANDLKWVAREEHREGALWSLFVAGYRHAAAQHQAEAEALREAFAPVNDWCESDEHAARSLVDKLRDAVADLQEDRTEALALRGALQALVEFDFSVFRHEDDRDGEALNALLEQGQRALAAQPTAEAKEVSAGTSARPIYVAALNNLAPQPTREALVAEVERYIGKLKERAGNARVYSDHQTAGWVENIAAELAALLPRPAATVEGATREEK